MGVTTTECVRVGSDLEIVKGYVSDAIGATERLMDKVRYKPEETHTAEVQDLQNALRRLRGYVSNLHLKA